MRLVYCWPARQVVPKRWPSVTPWGARSIACSDSCSPKASCFLLSPELLELHWLVWHLGLYDSCHQERCLASMKSALIPLCWDSACYSASLLELFLDCYPPFRDQGRLRKKGCRKKFVERLVVVGAGVRWRCWCQARLQW